MIDLFHEPVRKTPDRNAEGRMQIAIVEYVRWVAPRVIIFHPANGGWRTRAEAARFKAMGTLAGIPDLVLVLPEGHCAFWEVKAPSGRLSSDQNLILAHLDYLGHTTAVVRSIDDARQELAKLGVPTREAFA